MNEPGPRFWEIFFEVYEFLPRQGPGNRACAAKALGLCSELPESPVILDLGCGVGGQTLQLVELTSGHIVAIDSHAPSIERLRAAVARRGLKRWVSAVVGDMAQPQQPPGSFDLIWSEGALYHIGLRNALQVCHGLLRPGGYLAFSDAVWRRENPPPEVKAGFDLEYPTMGRVADDVAAIRDCGFELIDHFTLPDEAWWDDFYTPMEARIAELRGKYGDDAEASAILDQLAQEPAMHRRYSDFYAYEFFVVRRPSSVAGQPPSGKQRQSGKIGGVSLFFLHRKRALSLSGTMPNCVSLSAFIVSPGSGGLGQRLNFLPDPLAVFQLSPFQVERGLQV